MPRKFLKKYSPSPKAIRENKALSCLGESVHKPSLWHMNRRSVSKAFAIGLFCTWIPMPMQTLLAAALAIYYRAHLPLSVVLVFITNPITIPPMFYSAYKLGSFLLGMEPQPVAMDLSWQWFTTTMGDIWQPLLFGSIILGTISSIIAYFTINIIWRNSIKSRWKDRTSCRFNRKTDPEDIDKELSKNSSLKD